MLLCSVQSKPRLVGSDHGQSLVHKQNPDYPATVHLIHQTWAHTMLLCLFGFGDGVAGVFGLVGVLKHNRSS